MNRDTLFGEDYSYLVPLLLSKKENGRVHSRFSNGFNIKMGDSLVFIGNKKNGLLPFGVHLREEDTLRAVSSVNNGDPVIWNKGTNAIVFPGVTISLEKGKSFKNDLSALTSRKVFEDNFERFCLQLSRVENKTGLDISIQEFLNKFDEGTLEQHGVELYLTMLMDAAKSGNEALMEDAFRYFLGRGQGLTPSGDDMICGILAFDAISHFLLPNFYQKVSDLIENESITTDVAKEYLRYALKQEYSSTVSEMVNALSGGNADQFEQVFYDLLGVGHSSGLDTLFGILLAMMIFKDKNFGTETI